MSEELLEELSPKTLISEFRSRYFKYFKAAGCYAPDLEERLGAVREVEKEIENRLEDLNKRRRIVDRTGEKCIVCDGTYRETSLFDDMDGALHCDKCGNKQNRFYRK